MYVSMYLSIPGIHICRKRYLECVEKNISLNILDFELKITMGLHSNNQMIRAVLNGI